MLEIALSLLATLVACFAVLVAVALSRFLRAGPGSVAYLRRKQYGLRPWATGNLSKTVGGSTIHELEGLELKAKRGRLVHVRKTRAAASDL